MHAFNVYIDESGDEGFRFLPDRAQSSSEWFVLSAVVTRKEKDLDAVKLIDTFRQLTGKASGSEIHFLHVKHHHRVPLLDLIGHAPLRTVSVLVHKLSLDGDVYSTSGLLYRYATRLLLERVSWLCRDSRTAPEQVARLIFSNRANMSYEVLYAYLQDLRERSESLGCRIDWSAVDCEKIRTEPHHRMRGLQVADAVASGFFHATRMNNLGYNEPRYAELLRPSVYSHKKVRFGYGIKLMPAELIRSAAPLPDIAWMRAAAWQ